MRNKEDRSFFFSFFFVIKQRPNEKDMKLICKKKTVQMRQKKRTKMVVETYRVPGDGTGVDLGSPWIP